MDSYEADKLPEDKDELHWWMSEMTENFAELLCCYVFKHFELIDRDAKQPDQILDIESTLNQIDRVQHETLKNKLESIWNGMFERDQD